MLPARQRGDNPRSPEADSPHSGTKGPSLSLRILVLEGITERGAEILRSEGWVVDMEKALPPAELCAKVPPYHAILVRSGSQMNAQVIEA